MIHSQCYTRSYQVKSPLTAPSNSTHTLLKQRFNFSRPSIISTDTSENRLWVSVMVGNILIHFLLLFLFCLLNDVTIIADSNGNRNR